MASRTHTRTHARAHQARNRRSRAVALQRGPWRTWPTAWPVAPCVGVLAGSGNDACATGSARAVSTGSGPQCHTRHATDRVSFGARYAWRWCACAGVLLARRESAPRAAATAQKQTHVCTHTRTCMRTQCVGSGGGGGGGATVAKPHAPYTLAHARATYTRLDTRATSCMFSGLREWSRVPPWREDVTTSLT